MDSFKRKMLKKQFTLVELLVVVAIIAVIGSGIAMTYQNLDDHAKTAMEMSDMSALKKSVKHWSAVNNYKLPDGLDSLVDDEGNLYTPQQFADNSMTPTPSSTSKKGLNGPVGYATLEVAEAPDVVLQNLQAAGMKFTYLHRVAAGNANDSTFETGRMGGAVDTANTKATLVVGDTEARDHAKLIVAGDDSSHDYDGADDVEGNADDTDFTVDGDSFKTAAEFAQAQIDAQAILDAITTDKLAFVFPGGGTTMMGQTAPMNFTDEIITNAGLTQEQVANPNQTPSGAQKYYLVAMGFGRFCSIYQGKAVRADAPVTGKRQPQADDTYSRYLAVVRVPTAKYSTMTGSSEAPVLVDVLSPQGYSVAALRDNFIDDKEKIQD